MPGPTPEQLAAPGTEAAEQTALFCWAALNTSAFPELKLLYHCPNGGTRNKIEAGRLKAQGVRSGVPDVHLPVARWGKHGLYIEMKVGNNKPSPEQEQWIQGLLDQGFAVVVCYSWQQAADYIKSYLQGPDERHKNRINSPSATCYNAHL